MFSPQNVGSVNGPIRHTPGLEEFFLKMLIFPQMKKSMVVPLGAHTWGASNKVLYHTFIHYKYWLLTLREKKL